MHRTRVWWLSVCRMKAPTSSLFYCLSSLPSFLLVPLFFWKPPFLEFCLPLYQLSSLLLLYAVPLLTSPTWVFSSDIKWGSEVRWGPFCLQVEFREIGWQFLDASGLKWWQCGSARGRVRKKLMGGEDLHASGMYVGWWQAGMKGNRGCGGLLGKRDNWALPLVIGLWK